MNTQKPPISRKKFSPADDMKLTQLVKQHGTANWKLIADKMQIYNRRQCRDRWVNYLNPDLTFASWSLEEDALLSKCVFNYGTQWKSLITYFPNRSPNQLKSRWARLQNLSKDYSIVHPAKDQKHEENEYQDPPSSPIAYEENITDRVTVCSVTEQNQENNTYESTFTYGYECSDLEGDLEAKEKSIFD